MGKLEAEFEQFKAVHKYATLKARLIKYYTDLQDGKVNLPDFMRDDTPEKLADAEIRRILCMPDGLERFDRLYNTCWEEIAEVMP